MHHTIRTTFKSTLALCVLVMPLAACGVEDPGQATTSQQAQAESGHQNRVEELGEIFRASTAKYHKVSRAIADGFIQLFPNCATEESGAVLGIVYAKLARFDGTLKASEPEVLLYEPDADGSLDLVGGEYLVPISVTDTAPVFFGQTLEEEDDMGVWGLHVWGWRHNPNGLTAASNPNVHCL